VLFQIKKWLDGSVIFEKDADSLKIVVEAAVSAGVKLDGARLNGASLVRARLDGASLNGASLNGASLNGASLVRARLDGASLNGASLVRARLVRARLDGASLNGASLVRARLDGASLNGASLDGASLDGASLDGASLDGASLDGARLDGARLDTGETWEEYLSVTVPALCTAGGRTLEEVSAGWECHSWDNCPMHIAFNGARGDSDPKVPILLRPRVRQFVKLFDSRLIPRPIPASDLPTTCPTPEPVA
jgi:hypothetical protein